MRISGFPVPLVHARRKHRKGRVLSGAQVGQKGGVNRRARARSPDKRPPPGPGQPLWRIVAHHGVEVEAEPATGGERRRLRISRRSNLVVGDEGTLDGERLRPLPRRTELLRRAAGGVGTQPLAANVALLGVVVTRDPPPRSGLIDRAVVAARAAGIEPIVIVNKVDLPGVEELVGELREHFAGALEVLGVSATAGTGVPELEARLHRAGLSVLVGPSGVGKSSLTNRLLPHADLEVGALSEATGRGRHTTTRATLWRSEAGVELIDTPGIRDFGLVKVPADELAHHFPGFEPFEAACRFRDCRHRGEPGCAVAAAVAAHELPEERLEAYRTILAELEEEAARLGPGSH